MGAFALMMGFIFILQNSIDKTEIILLENEKKNSSIIITSNSKQTLLDKPNSYYELLNIEALSKDKKVLTQEEVNAKFGNLIKNSLKPPVSLLFYFTDGVNLDEKSKEKLSQIKNTILSREPCEVDIIGHADRLGDDEYNIKLSLKRAEVLEKFIKKQNLPISKLTVESFGENDPIIPTEDGVREPLNRRVEVLVK